MHRLKELMLSWVLESHLPNAVMLVMYDDFKDVFIDNCSLFERIFPPVE